MPAGPALAPAELDERLDRLRLGLLARSIRRSLPWLLLFDAFCAWLMWRTGRPAAALAWFAAMVALALWRRSLLLRAEQHPIDGIRRTTRTVLANGLAQGLLLSLLALAAFTQPAVGERYLVTTLCVGVAAGTAATSGWPPRGFALWTGVLGVVLVGGWLSHRDVNGAAMAALVLGMLVLLAQQVRDQHHALRRLVQLAAENERLAASLRVERDRVQAAGESKMRFFAAAGHDLRQPLHALALNALTLGLLARRHGDPALLRVSDGIDRSLRQGSDLLDGLLDVSRLDAGAVQPQPVAVELAGLLDGVALAFAPQALERGLALTLDIDPALRGCCTLTDPELLRRVLDNLVANALKFTRRGGVRLVLRAAADGRAELTVADTGIGISPEDQARVFEEFYQGHNPARERGQGLGLGLAIVRRLTALLDTGLALHSTPGEGTRVVLTLPGALSAVAPQPAAPGAGTPEAWPALRPGLRALVVDDEVEIRDGTAALLRQLGCSVHGAAGCEEAVAAVDAGFVPDLLLADLRLRGTDGIGTALAVRERAGTRLPVLIVTGDTAPHTLQQVQTAGLKVLHKPVTGAGLARALREALAARAGD